MKPIRCAQTLLLFSLVALSLSSASCPTTQDPAEEDPCAGANFRDVRDSVSVSPGENFYLEAPPGENDCHASYYVSFRYKDDFLAATEETMPPVDNLAKGFGPAGEFTYFPHPQPVMSIENGVRYWTVSFNAGNKNSGFPSTEHSISLNVPSDATESVIIDAVIEYIPKQ